MSDGTEPKAADSPPREALSASTGFLLNKAAQRVLAEFEDVLEPFELGSREFGVLSLLDSRGPHSQHSISKQLQIDRTTMVAVIDDLEQRGLVTRARDARDRRKYAVDLTARGRELMRNALERLDGEINEQFLKPLQPHEREQLNALLSRLVYSHDG